MKPEHNHQSFEEAVKWAEKHTPAADRCPLCSGSGLEAKTIEVDEGRGVNKKKVKSPTGEYVFCTTCRGSGKRK